MKHLLLSIFIFHTLLLFSQSYKYKNSFEKYYELPKNLGDYTAKGSFSPSDDGSATPDYFHQKAKGEVKLTKFLFGKTYFGKTSPHKGKAAAGIIAFKRISQDDYYREYITMNIDRMTKGKEYRISVFLKNGTINGQRSIEQLSVLFSTRKVVQKSYKPILQKPQYNITTDKPIRKWTEFSDTLKADSAYNYATIGYFDTKNPQADLEYFFIDDFSITEVADTSNNTIIQCKPGSTLGRDAGGSEITETRYNLGCKKGKFKLWYNMYDIADSIIIYNSKNEILYNKLAKDEANDSIKFDTETIKIKIIGSKQLGTSWEYKVYCPN